MELCGHGEFRLVPAPGSRIDEPVLKDLSDISGGALGANKRGWRFPLAAYDAVLQQIRSRPAVSTCELELLPDWLLLAVRNHSSSPVGAPEFTNQVEEFLNQMPSDIIEERPVMQFQKEGIRFGLSRQGRCLLADEMGLGKTLQALAIIAQYEGDWPVLVVAPSALRLVWRDQATTWLPHILGPGDVQVLSQGKQEVCKDAKLVITSYELLSRNARFQARADGQAYKAIIVDEAHYIKDPKSKRTGVILKMCRAATRCVLISGTPAVNRASELCTLLQALLPAKASPSFTKFCERYCERQDQHLPGGAKVVKWLGSKRKTELNALLTGTVMIRRLKNEVLKQLPKKRRQRIALDASTLNAGIMKELKTLMRQREDDLENGENPQPGPAVTNIYKLTAQAKVDGVGEYVEYLLSNDIKFLLFAHHHVMLDGLEQKLKALGAKYVRIDGNTPAQKRGVLVEQYPPLVRSPCDDFESLESVSCIFSLPFSCIYLHGYLLQILS
ncbi:unnamed protein product [Polarella glacialis]|uniref:Helicase ATP-binding domain-containing protein n=1 Tax=Polarella glacialis TaxID=89957 RepID=A0A813DU52_POLGL|nr:unnamed protein product [Polarella glacialis]